jgi:regulatory protein
MPMPTPPKNSLSLKARAVGYLSRREHARAELARKLRPYAEGPDGLAEIEAVLDDLQREGWLNNERYAQSLVHRRAPQRGTARIVQELRQQGLDDAVVARAREQLKATEYERALAIWTRRYGGKSVPPAADPAEYARQARFLAGRGFSHETIRRVLGSGDPSQG